MDKVERIKMIKAMEFIVRQVNDESIMNSWLMVGVADGDIEYGDLSVNVEDLEFDNAASYIEDDTFSDTMAVFLRVMSRAYRSGGLYCDDVVSSEEN